MDLRLDTKDIDVLAREFKLADKERPRILTRSINRTLPKARTLSNQAIREDLALPAAYVRERLSIRKANYSNLRGRLTAKGRPILWGRFKFRATRKGVSARINKQEGRRQAPGGFVVPIRAGGKRLNAPVVRQPGRYSTGSGRFKPLYGPSVPEVLNEKKAKLDAPIGEYLQLQVGKQVETLMRKL